MSRYREIIKLWENGEEAACEKLIAELEGKDDELKTDLKKSAGMVYIEYLNEAYGRSPETILGATSITHMDIMQRASLRIIELLEELKSEVSITKLPVTIGLDLAKPDSERIGVVCRKCSCCYTILPGEDRKCPGCGQ